MDKPYYDYDYTPVEKKRSLPVDNTIWGADKVSSLFKHAIEGGGAAARREETELELAERLQREAAEQHKSNKSGR